MPLMWIFDTPCPLPCLPLPLTLHPLPHPIGIQPSLLGASLTSNMVRASSCRVLWSINILLSTRASSPSNFSIGFGVLASSTKWLSQCGQYSSLSSNTAASFRKAFLHFLQAKVWGALGSGLVRIWIMEVLPCPFSAVTHDLRSRDGTRRNQTIFGLLNS
jgi:hypothetical protein